MKRRSIITSLVAVGALAAPACASAGMYLSHYGPLYASGSKFAGPYESAVTDVSAYSTGTAFAGTWVSNSSGGRVSADNYCSSGPGCIAALEWYGPYPAGYGTAENHGNASPSYFSGDINDG